MFSSKITLVGMAILALLTNPATAADQAGDAKPSAKPKTTASQVRAKLWQRIDLNNGIDPNTPLKDALEFLSQTYDLPIILDEKAFESIGVQKAGEQPVALPKMSDVRLAVVLRMLVSQVKGDEYAGAYLVRPDGVVVTTNLEVLEEVLGSEAKPTDLLGRQPGFSQAVIPQPRPAFQQIIHVDVKEKPLAEALRELAEREGINIVVDTRAADKASTVVSATMNNVWAGTAVRLLAELADLKVLVLNNVLYVTTKQNAKELEEARAKRQAANSD